MGGKKQLEIVKSWNTRFWSQDSKWYAAANLSIPNGGMKEMPQMIGTIWERSWHTYTICTDNINLEILMLNRY